MNIQVLPNVFKKISLFLFFIGIMIPLTDGFLHPFESNEGGGEIRTAYGHLLGSFFLIGIVMYFLSKEKIEDELVKKLRSEAFSLTFLLSAIGLLLFHFFGDAQESYFDATSLIMLQIITFLIIFYFKKRSFDL